MTTNLLFPTGDETSFSSSSLVIGGLLGLSILLLGALGWYACKKMAFEVTAEGLWRQGLWKRQLMPWEDVLEVGEALNGASVKGRVDGAVVCWQFNPVFTNERSTALQRAIIQRAPQASTDSLR